MRRAWLGQWLGALVCAAGIGFEVAMVITYNTPAEAGAALIAAGALAWGISTKLRRGR